MTVRFVCGGQMPRKGLLVYLALQANRCSGRLELSHSLTKQDFKFLFCITSIWYLWTVCIHHGTITKQSALPLCRRCPHTIVVPYVTKYLTKPEFFSQLYSRLIINKILYQTGQIFNFKHWSRVTCTCIFTICILTCTYIVYFVFP